MRDMGDISIILGGDHTSHTPDRGRPSKVVLASRVARRRARIVSVHAYPRVLRPHADYHAAYLRVSYVLEYLLAPLSDKKSADVRAVVGSDVIRGYLQ